MNDTNVYISDLYKLWDSNRDAIYKLNRSNKKTHNAILMIGMGMIGIGLILRKQTAKIDTLTEQMEELNKSKGV